MTPSREVLPIAEFRTRLPELVKRVSADPSARVDVGAHRRPEAVLMAAAADMPYDIRNLILAGFFQSEADHAIRILGARRGNFLHIGDGFGRAFAWLWRANPDEALMHLAGYLAQLRFRHPQAPTPRIRLDDVLEALRPASDITDDEYPAICARARVEVPKYYTQRDDVNS